MSVDAAKDLPSEQDSLGVTASKAQQSIKHEWYQTESCVTVSVFIKNQTSQDVNVTTQERQLTLESTDPAKLTLSMKFNLSHSINPSQTQIKFLSTKIEIKLMKVESIQWKSLEGGATEVLKQIQVVPTPTAKPPEYPSSSKKHKDWDKIAHDVEVEEKDEKVEGDAALNKLFQQIYKDGSDETRKAMNKSFVESGGTVLSTNWNEVGAKTLDVKPPDGMEFKKWDN